MRAVLVVTERGSCRHSVVEVRDAKCPIAYWVVLDIGRNPSQNADNPAKKHCRNSKNSVLQLR